MSAFLGPIHHWLYDKIRRQYILVTKLWTLGDSYGLTLEKDCNHRFGAFPEESLEEIIDTSNIHGWLQKHVSLVENQFAYTVLTLISHAKNIAELDTNELYEQIRTIVVEDGSSTASSYKDSSLTAAQVFKIISDTLLDGMPCDHANQIISQSPEELVWKRNLCVHKEYWTGLEGDVSIYYDLRDGWFQGFLGTLSYTLDKIDEITYKIRKL